MHRRTGQIDDHEKYKKIRSDLNNLQRKTYREYLAKIGSGFTTNPREFWSFANSRKDGCQVPSIMTRNQCELSDPKEIIQEFARFFSNTYIVSEDEGVELCETQTYVSLLASNINTFSETDVENVLKKLPSTSVAGPDQIPSFLSKIVQCVLLNLYS